MYHTQLCACSVHTPVVKYSVYQQILQYCIEALVNTQFEIWELQGLMLAEIPHR